MCWGGLVVLVVVFFVFGGNGWFICGFIFVGVLYFFVVGGGVGEFWWRLGM